MNKLNNSKYNQIFVYCFLLLQISFLIENKYGSKMIKIQNKPKQINLKVFSNKKLY